MIFETNAMRAVKVIKTFALVGCFCVVDDTGIPTRFEGFPEAHKRKCLKNVFCVAGVAQDGSFPPKKVLNKRESRKKASLVAIEIKSCYLREE